MLSRQTGNSANSADGIPKYEIVRDPREEEEEYFDQIFNHRKQSKERRSSSSSYYGEQHRRSDSDPCITDHHDRARTIFSRGSEKDKIMLEEF